MPILSYGQSNFIWDSGRQDQSKVLMYYPAGSELDSFRWYDVASEATLNPIAGDTLFKVSGRGNFYASPYTKQPRYGATIDSVTVINKGGITYTGDSLSVYFTFKMGAEQLSTIARFISLVDTAGVAGDHNGFSLWFYNSRLQVSSNGKHVAGSSKFLLYKTYLVETHVNSRGATIVLDGDTLYHNRSFTPYNFNINGLVIGSDLDTTDYVNDIVLGDLMITEGPLSWVREAFNEKYHNYEDIAYESITSIADSHPVGLLVDLTKLDASRFMYLNNGRETQSDYYHGIWDTIFSSDLIGEPYRWWSNDFGYDYSENGPFRMQYTKGAFSWLPRDNGSGSWYWGNMDGTAITGNDGTYTLLQEFGQSSDDNNPSSQIWNAGGIYYYEDSGTDLPNYIYNNSSSLGVDPYYPQIMGWVYDSLHIAGYVGKYFPYANDELAIYHNGAPTPMYQTGADPTSSALGSTYWFTRSTPNNLKWPARWAQTVVFENQMGWREANYLMKNWGRIDFRSICDDPISSSFIHEYEAASQYITVKSGTDTLEQWIDKMGRINVVDTTVVGYDNNVIGVATVDTINWSVECREERHFYIPFDSCWKYRNVNVYIVMKDLSNGTDSSWIGLIHTNTAQETDQALLRWNYDRNSIAYNLGHYSNGTSTTGEEYFKAAHLNYYDPEYWPRWNLNGSGASNRYAITIDDDDFRGDDKVTFDSMANKKQIIMLEGVNTQGFSGLSMGWVASTTQNGNYDIKHVIITHGEEEPERVFQYLRDKYYDWLDDPYFRGGLLDPNAQDYLVSYDISELIDTSLYPVGAYFDWGDAALDYIAQGAAVKNSYDRVTGYRQSTGVGGNPDYVYRQKSMLGSNVPIMEFKLATYSFGRLYWEGAITDTSFTVLAAVKAHNFATTNVNGYMSLITGNSSIGPWWNTGSGTLDQTRFQVNGSDKWTWSGMDDTLSVIGYSLNKNGALKGVRYLAGETSNTWFQKNYSSATATIDFNPGALQISMTADPRGANGAADVDYYDKFIALDGALPEVELKLLTRFYPKLRIDKYPHPEIVNIPNDLQVNVLSQWDHKYGRRQDNSTGSNNEIVRWYYNTDNVSTYLQQSTEADRPFAVRTGGIDFDGTGNHMDYTDFLDEGSGVGDFSVFFVVVTDDTTGSHSWLNYSSGSTTGGNDVFINLADGKRIGLNKISYSGNLRDESTVQGFNCGLEFDPGDTVLIGFTADENGPSYFYINGERYDILEPDGTWYGADDLRTFGMERYGNSLAEGQALSQYWFNKALSQDEVRRLTDSIISVYPNIVRKKKMDLSFNPHIILEPSLRARTSNGVSALYDVSLRSETQYPIEQSVDANKPVINEAEQTLSFERSKYMEWATSPFDNTVDSVFTFALVLENDSIYPDWNQTRALTLANGDFYFFLMTLNLVTNDNPAYWYLNFTGTDDHPTTEAPNVQTFNMPYDVPFVVVLRGSETRGLTMWINGEKTCHVGIEVPGWDGIAGSVFDGLNKRRNSSDYWGDWDLWHFSHWDQYLSDKQISIITNEIVTQLESPELDSIIAEYQTYNVNISDSIDNTLYAGWELSLNYVDNASYPMTGGSFIDFKPNNSLSIMDTDADVAALNFSGTGVQIWSFVNDRNQRFVPLFNQSDEYTMDGTYDFPDTCTFVMRFRRKLSQNLYPIAQYTAANATTAMYITATNDVQLFCGDEQYDTGVNIQEDSVFYIAWTWGGDKMSWDIIKMVGAVERANPSVINLQDWGSGSHTFTSSAPTIDRLIIAGYDSGAGTPTNSDFTPTDYMLLFEGKLAHEELEFLARNIEARKQLSR